VVKSDYGIFRVEDLELEMPPSSGQLTNLEGMFTKILTDLEQDQPARQIANPDLHAALSGIIQRLTKMLHGSAFPITVTLNDISGNSFIEPSPKDTGSKYIRNDHPRTREQNETLGLGIDEEHEDSQGGGMEGVDIVDGEIYEIPDQCPACSKACTVNMKKVNIPHFKEVIIMATVCEYCGYRSSDVKTGGAVPEKGKRITLAVKSKEDLSRDILKSETCALRSMELGLEVQPGTLGGRFTTVEGLLTQVRDQLHGQIYDVGNEGLSGGDSMTEQRQVSWTAFFEKLEKALAVEFEFSLTLEDPLANSFVQATMDDDPQIVEEEYERTAEELEDLGLNDMKTEVYGNEERE
jgi:zinc finger protein